MIKEHFRFFAPEIADKIREEVLKLDFQPGEVDKENVEPVGKSAEVKEGTYIYDKLISKLEGKFLRLQAYKLKRVFVNLFEPGELPYFHKDAAEGNRGITYIYYVDEEEWKIDDRGETDIFEGLELRSFIPIHNKLLEFDAAYLHRGNSLRDRNRYSIVAQYVF